MRPRRWLGSVWRRLRGLEHRGYCPICERPVWFVIEGSSLRDRYRCRGCRSIPRWRALMSVLADLYPDWRRFAIHESSPGGPLSDKLARECPGYLGTQFFPGVAPGEVRDGCRCEDLTRQTFEDESFDLVITSDVFEHVFHADLGLREIARTLRPGGAHLFTIPWYRDRPTRVRAEWLDGRVAHRLPPAYHVNPVDPQGSLVVTEWGREFPHDASEWSGLPTVVFRTVDRSRGLAGEFLEVFVTRKPGRPVAAEASRGVPLSS